MLDVVPAVPVEREVRIADPGRSRLELRGVAPACRRYARRQDEAQREGEAKTTIPHETACASKKH